MGGLCISGTIISAAAVILHGVPAAERVITSPKVNAGMLLR